MIYIQIYGLYLLFLLNHFTFKNSFWTSTLFKELRFLLFPIQGACQHSGNCCRGIMLYHNSEIINTLKQYNLLSERFSSDHRFRPVLNENDSSETQISHYNCTKLSTENYCVSYHDRPSLCRQYPWSFFYEHGYLKSNCGYFLKMRSVFLPFIPSILERKLAQTQQFIQSQDDTAL